MRVQRIGLAVLGVAAVLVTAIAGLRPHLADGSAHAAPVPGPPAIGDCVLDPVPAPGVVYNTPAANGPASSYPVQLTGACTAYRYGEITAVIAIPSTPAKGGNIGSMSSTDPNASTCIAAARQFLGITPQPIQQFWRTALQFSSWLSGPSPRQEAGGQHWAACIVALRAPDSASTETAGQRYATSIRDALHTGGQRDQLGYCLPGADWHYGFASYGCSQPHALEQLAYGDSGEHPINRAQVEITCRQLVLQLTDMPDPTDGGALTIAVHVEDSSGTPITTSQIPAHSNLDCGVLTTGHHQLDGSLLALGHHPIPWA